jgi:hypothetical protein
MGDPNGPVLRRSDVLAALERHGVEFLLVGGQAGIVYGAQRPTTDLDLVLRWSPENLNRMGEVLVEFNAGIRVEGIAEGYPMPHRDGAFLGTMEISTWRSPSGDIDVLRGLPAAKGREIGFEELATRAQNMVLDGHPVRVASLPDIIVSKQTANRPSDLIALPELLEIAERQQLTKPPERDD